MAEQLHAFLDDLATMWSGNSMDNRVMQQMILSNIDLITGATGDVDELKKIIRKKLPSDSTGDLKQCPHTLCYVQRQSGKGSLLVAFIATMVRNTAGYIGIVSGMSSMASEMKRKAIAVGKLTASQRKQIVTPRIKVSSTYNKVDILVLNEPSYMELTSELTFPGSMILIGTYLPNAALDELSVQDDVALLDFSGFDRAFASLDVTLGVPERVLVSQSV